MGMPFGYVVQEAENKFTVTSAGVYGVTAFPRRSFTFETLSKARSALEQAANKRLRWAEDPELGPNGVVRVRRWRGDDPIWTPSDLPLAAADALGAGLWCSPFGNIAPDASPATWTSVPPYSTLLTFSSTPSYSGGRKPYLFDTAMSAVGTAYSSSSPYGTVAFAAGYAPGGPARPTVVDLGSIRIGSDGTWYVMDVVAGTYYPMVASTAMTGHVLTEVDAVVVRISNVDGGNDKIEGWVNGTQYVNETVASLGNLTPLLVGGTGREWAGALAGLYVTSVVVTDPVIANLSNFMKSLAGPGAVGQGNL